MNDHRLANVFGALTIAVSDGIAADAESALARGGATAAALVVIGHVPGIAIDALARGLGLSHPGAVRLTDRLQADGYVERRTDPKDRRGVLLHLTTEGKRKRRAILRERQRALEAMLSPLTAVERERLGEIADKLLTARVGDVETALRVCRFCDEAVCDACPVETALGA